MTIVRAQMDASVEEAATTLRQVATEQGWAFAEGEGAPGSLVFKKGVTSTSWGSRVTARLEASSPTETRLTFSTYEKWVLTDWGRGCRQVTKLIESLGAVQD